VICTDINQQNMNEHTARMNPISPHPTRVFIHEVIDRAQKLAAILKYRLWIGIIFVFCIGRDTSDIRALVSQGDKLTINLVGRSKSG